MKKCMFVVTLVSLGLLVGQAGAQDSKPWPMWEFETDGDLEGWRAATNGQISADVKDGALVVDVVANAGDPWIWGPESGPHEAESVTGFLAKMRHTADPTGGGGRQFFIFPIGPHQFISWNPPAPDPTDGVVYVDLATDPPEKWTGLIRSIRFDFSNISEPYQVEIDWIRPEGLYIRNETMAYWDFTNDKILAWDLVGNADNFNFDEQVIVDSMEYALALTGDGTAQGLSQSVKGGADMILGKRLVVMGAVNIPTDAPDTKVTVRVVEKVNGTENVTEMDVEVAAAGDYVDFTTGPFASLKAIPEVRDNVSIEVLVTAPSGKVVYLDSIFVNAMEPVRTTGWPVNCVKLAAGQAIAVDGVVSAAEYQGAQAMVINTNTAAGVDPFFPLSEHDMTNRIGGQWGATPVEDFNGVYYMMWDDEALYVAVACEDDSYQFVGPGANEGDALQFTITETPFEIEPGYLYIPTVAPAGADGNPVAQNNFPGPFIQTDLFAQAGTEVAGSVDAASQNWMVEVKIPWSAMQGDFKGDSEAQTKFPPQIGDTIGFNVVAHDYDLDDDGNPEQQLMASTHGGDWPWSPWPWKAADEASQEAMTFVGPAQ